MSSAGNDVLDCGMDPVLRKREPRVDRRNAKRFPFQFKVAIVYHQHKDAATRPRYHGVTSDISLAGLSVVVDRNIFNEGDVTVLIAIPPEHPASPQKIIEATAKMAYTVLSATHQGFRIGMEFKDFKRDGWEILCAAIEHRSFTSVGDSS